MAKTSLVLAVLMLNVFSQVSQGTSIPVDKHNYSSVMGKSGGKMESDELFLDIGPYSMEDLASKEKIFVNRTPYYPEVILKPHHLRPPGETSSEDGMITEVVDESEEEEEEETSFEESEEDDEEMPSPVTTTPDPTTTTPPPPPTTSPEPSTSQTTTSPPDQPDVILVMVESIPENLQVSEVIDPTTPIPLKQNKDEMEGGAAALPVVKAQFDEEIDERLFLILQNSVRETYFAFRDILGNRHRTQMKTLEDDLRGKLKQLDVDLNVKIVSLDTTTHSRIQTLTGQIIDQRKEDIQTFSDNLHQLQKTHQMHMDSNRVEIQQLQVQMDLLNKGQSSLATKLSQVQKVLNNLDSKVNEIVIKSSEDLNGLRDGQKLVASVLDELQLDIKTNDAEFRQMQEIVGSLQKSATEDHGKLRRTLIRDQKQEPLQVAIRHLRNKNVGAAIKQWRTIESIADDLKETLPGDISKIIDESYGKNAANLATVTDFVHRAVGHGDRRLKEAAYGSLLADMDSNKQLTDAKRTIEIFNLAQTMKADLGNYYNSSITTAEIVGKLPEIIKLITFDKVKLLLPTRGYLRVAADRKVTLVPQDGRFYDKDEILWHFEYDKDKADGTFYIKSDKLQKYLVTLQEGFNSYGFSKQGLFVTGNKKENGTRFQITIVNQGEYVLFKSVYYNGYLTWKSNVQTVYGDDDSYFLLLLDRKNGPSPYWNIQAEAEEL
ncbi:uncharacterized protein LOC110852712 [Folsomia candida]|uniref:uncharacterized protein LOC110852712 n=1 Tax=Folsomia candida TaxID=158441 RepID=UPI000B8FD822|nr:uncharacterized protein LOC110852712 [Folsomia candida]